MYMLHLNKSDGYYPICTECVMHMCLGMLRDVLELKIGRKKAQDRYVAALASARDSMLDESLEACASIFVSRLFPNIEP